MRWLRSIIVKWRSTPKLVADINDAINYLHDHANKYNLAADNVVMMGRSAGGHLAGLVGASNMHGDISFYSESKYRVAGVVFFFIRPTCCVLVIKGTDRLVKSRRCLAS
ncbi:alpha/beta hydrolase fold domain-containing protein [Vibrio chagasii]|nr:alpha/beta hydrolase fold domain-containing protein [Vibrio chagasii]